MQRMKACTSHTSGLPLIRHHSYFTACSCHLAAVARSRSASKAHARRRPPAGRCCCPALPSYPLPRSHTSGLLGPAHTSPGCTPGSQSRQSRRWLSFTGSVMIWGGQGGCVSQGESLPRQLLGCSPALVGGAVLAWAAASLRRAAASLRRARVRPAADGVAPGQACRATIPLQSAPAAGAPCCTIKQADWQQPALHPIQLAASPSPCPCPCR